MLSILLFLVLFSSIHTCATACRTVQAVESRKRQWIQRLPGTTASPPAATSPAAAAAAACFTAVRVFKSLGFIELSFISAKQIRD